MSYQSPKTTDFGVNLCQGCLDKQREIDRLKEEVQQLRQKVWANQRKSQAGFFGSATPSSKLPVKPNSVAENQARRGGAVPGHKGSGRQVFPADEADQVLTVEVAEETCPGCQCQLTNLTSNERAVYELDRQTVKKVFYQIRRKRCPQCRQILAGRVRNVLPRAALSNGLIVEVASQHYVQGHTLGQISQTLGINYSTLAESLKRVSRQFEPVLERLKADYRSEAVRHADETGWRTDGANGYSWYFGSPQTSLHLFRQTRSSSVVKEVLGSEPLAGVLVVDRYAGYNRVPCRIQYCYAHLLREIKDLETEFESDGEVGNYASQMKLCLRDAMQLRQRGLDEAEYVKQATAIKAKILELSDRQAKHPAIRKWQDFFVEKQERLYQWCESSQIPCENNYAERELRKTVIARKLSYGSQSREGAKTREIWTSVLQTLKKRERHPRDKLIEMLNKLSENKELDIAGELFGSPAN